MNMSAFVYVLFTYLFVVDYVVLRVRALPKIVGTAPEIISGVILLIVCVIFAKRRTLNISAKYVLFFIFFILFLLIGEIVNQVQPGAIFSGIRKYFRYAPIFLLPLAYNFDDKDIGKLIKLLLVFCLFQLPIAIYQKLVLFKLEPTGDVIEGSIIGSGKLAVFLICAISIVLAYYLKGRVKLYKALVIILILFLPIGITEASASFFLLPIVFIVPILFVRKDRAQYKKLVTLMMMGFVFFAGFIAIYNLQYSSRWEGNILNAILDGQVFEKVYKEAEGANTGTREAKMAEIGRIDSMILPVQILRKKGLVNVLCGVGMGNASDSFTSVFQGEFFSTVEDYNSDITTVGNLLWEIGIVGVIFSYVLLLMVFFDALKLRHSNDRVGAIALGWLGVIIVIAITKGYTNILAHNVMGYVMWFFIGYIISQANMVNRVLYDNR